MLLWALTTIGFLISLFIVGWIFIHFLRKALPTEDSTTIDKLPKNHD